MSVLVAGVGNIFRSDDGFGSEAARRLASVQLPERVRVVDYGIRGMHLAYDLLDGYDALVILDAAPRGGAAGDIVVLEVGHSEIQGGGLGTGELDAHGMEPTAVLASLGALGGRLPRTFVVGCEPADVSEGIGLSPAVAAAAERAVGVVTDLLANELAPAGPAGTGSGARTSSHPSIHPSVGTTRHEIGSNNSAEEHVA